MTGDGKTLSFDRRPYCAGKNPKSRKSDCRDRWPHVVSSTLDSTCARRRGEGDSIHSFQNLEAVEEHYASTAMVVENATVHVHVQSVNTYKQLGFFRWSQIAYLCPL